MNWTHFLLWVAALYALYYLAVVLIDLAGGNRKPAEHHTTQELTFSENVAPAQLQHKPAVSAAHNPVAAKRKAEPEVIASGGVGFNELFRLAKQEAIIYTQSVSF
ncbi:MAG TPA: hypothetical protein VGM63_23615 [Mucilaginibacter sp.]|jgi:hypothetical protein